MNDLSNKPRGSRIEDLAERMLIGLAISLLTVVSTLRLIGIVQ